MKNEPQGRTHFHINGFTLTPFEKEAKANSEKAYYNPSPLTPPMIEHILKHKEETLKYIFSIKTKANQLNLRFKK